MGTGYIWGDETDGIRAPYFDLSSSGWTDGDGNWTWAFGEHRCMRWSADGRRRPVDEQLLGLLF